jgi:hypothetical protein
MQLKTMTSNPVPSELLLQLVAQCKSRISAVINEARGSNADFEEVRRTPLHIWTVIDGHLKRYDHLYLTICKMY